MDLAFGPEQDGKWPRATWCAMVMVVHVVMRAEGKALAHCVLELLPQRAAGQSLVADGVFVRRGRHVPGGGAAALPVPATPRGRCGPSAELVRPLWLQPAGTGPVERAPRAFLASPDVAVCAPAAEAALGSSARSFWLLLRHGCVFQHQTLKNSQDVIDKS